jgi:NTP pyrophosphatase (non-canonical NTP hydrolase)
MNKIIELRSVVKLPIMDDRSFWSHHYQNLRKQLAEEHSIRMPDFESISGTQFHALFTGAKMLQGNDAQLSKNTLSLSWNTDDIPVELVGGSKQPWPEPEDDDRPFDPSLLKVNLCGLQHDIHQTACDHGWWDEQNEMEYQMANRDMPTEQREFVRKAVIGQKLCLMHSEISEGMEGERKNLDDDKLPQYSMLEVELADCMIRIFDFAERYSLDVVGALLDKAKFNKGRSYKHGGKAF